MCPIGRQFSETHPTCRSCQRQGAVICKKPKKARFKDLVRTWHNGKTLCTTAYMYSSNHWHGRPRYVYLAERKKWEQVLAGTWALWGQQGDQRRSVVVRRFVESAGGIILDQDNISAATKPIWDALRKHGVLVDDTESHLSFSVEQSIVPTGQGRVEIEVV